MPSLQSKFPQIWCIAGPGDEPSFATNERQRPVSPPAWQNRSLRIPPPQPPVPQLQRSESPAPTAAQRPLPRNQQNRAQEVSLPESQSQGAFAARDKTQMSIRRENPLLTERFSRAAAELDRQTNERRRAEPARGSYPNPLTELEGLEASMPLQSSASAARPRAPSGRSSGYWSRQEVAQPRFYKRQPTTSQPAEASQTQQRQPTSQPSFAKTRSSGRQQSVASAPEAQAPFRSGSAIQSDHDVEAGEEEVLAQQAAIIQSSPEMVFTANDALWHPELGSLLQQQGSIPQQSSAARDAEMLNASDLGTESPEGIAGNLDARESAEASLAAEGIGDLRVRDASSEQDEAEAQKPDRQHADSIEPPELATDHPSIVPHEREGDLWQGNGKANTPNSISKDRTGTSLTCWIALLDAYSFKSTPGV